MAEQSTFSVEVVYALPDRCITALVNLSAGATVADAIKISGLVDLHPQRGHEPHIAGIFGRRVSLSAELRGGDRIEIYRPLVADPKQARLTRARGADKGTR